MFLWGKNDDLKENFHFAKKNNYFACYFFRSFIKEMKSKINIENYEIISKIGEGGFGIVYKARQSGTKK